MLEIEFYETSQGLGVIGHCAAEGTPDHLNRHLLERLVAWWQRTQTDKLVTEGLQRRTPADPILAAQAG